MKRYEPFETYKLQLSIAYWKLKNYLVFMFWNTLNLKSALLIESFRTTHVFKIVNLAIRSD